MVADTGCFATPTRNTHRHTHCQAVCIGIVGFVFGTGQWRCCWWPELKETLTSCFRRTWRRMLLHRRTTLTWTRRGGRRRLSCRAWASPQMWQRVGSPLTPACHSLHHSEHTYNIISATCKVAQFFCNEVKDWVVPSIECICKLQMFDISHLSMICLGKNVCNCICMCILLEI